MRGMEIGGRGVLEREVEWLFGGSAVPGGQAAVRAEQSRGIGDGGETATARCILTAERPSRSDRAAGRATCKNERSG